MLLLLAGKEETTVMMLTQMSFLKEVFCRFCNKVLISACSCHHAMKPHQSFAWPSLQRANEGTMCQGRRDVQGSV